MTISDNTVAIIGTGNIGSRLAANFAPGDLDFLLAGRDEQAARKLASDLDGHAEAVSVDEAIDRADVLVIAVWLPDFEQLIAQYGQRLVGKIIVDPTNPVGPDADGNYRKVIGAQESSGQILASLLPAGARLVKAFGTLSAPTLATAARREPERAVLFYAADDDAAGDLVADLIRVSGYEPLPVGGLDQSIRIEMFGDLHEYGALGRAVTKTEALAAVLPNQLRRRQMHTAALERERRPRVSQPDSRTDNPVQKPVRVHRSDARLAQEQLGRSARGYHELRTSSAAWWSSATARRTVGQAVFLYIATNAENSLFCRGQGLHGTVLPRTRTAVFLRQAPAHTGGFSRWQSFRCARKDSFCSPDDADRAPGAKCPRRAGGVAEGPSDRSGRRGQCQGKAA